MRLAALGLIVLPLAAAAQSAAPRSLPRPGDTVRVWADRPPLTGAQGIVRRVTTDTVVFALRSAQTRELLETPVAVSTLQRVDLIDLRSAGAERKSAWIFGGALVGAGVGALIGYKTADVSCDADCQATGGGGFDSPESRRGISAFIGGLGGLAIGALIGAVQGSQPVSGWRKVYP